MKRIIVITVAAILILSGLTVWLAMSRLHRHTVSEVPSVINSVTANPASANQAKQTLSQFEADKPLFRAQTAAEAFINIKTGSDCTSSIKELKDAGTIIELRIIAAQLQDRVASDLAQDMIVLEQDTVSACNSHQLSSLSKFQSTLATNLSYLSIRLSQDRSQ
jgi:hypothetical protein